MCHPVEGRWGNMAGGCEEDGWRMQGGCEEVGLRLGRMRGSRVEDGEDGEDARKSG